MGKTKISWATDVWNPIRGCSRVSTGCTACYAEQQAARIVRMGKGKPTAYDGLVKLVTLTRYVDGQARTIQEARWTGEVAFDSERLLAPLKWRKPRRIFTDSMSDLFHKGIRDDQIDRVVAVMMVCALADDRAGHTFQTLTKRADRLRSYFGDPNTQERVARAAGAMMEDGDHWFDDIMFRPDGLAHPSLWWGVSVEDQSAADERIPELLRTPAAVRFLSCEPLLGAVDLAGGNGGNDYLGDAHDDADGLPGIDWVIAGCESGPRARPCSVAWLRSLRDQCAATDVAFFLKQAVETDLGRCGDQDNPNGARPCGERVRAQVISPDTAAYSCGCTVEGAELGACAPGIGAGEGSKRKPGGVVELPYLDGVHHAAMPKAANV